MGGALATTEARIALRSGHNLDEVLFRLLGSAIAGAYMYPDEPLAYALRVDENKA